MNQPLVSVVIPIYNVEKYLDRCVTSVVNQTYKNLEIILVDDGSPDNCPAMCDKWAKKDSRIKVIHKENAGAGLARNMGIDNSCGEYVLFVDSDDYIDSETVNKCVSTAQNDGSDIVMFGRTDVKINGETEKKAILTDIFYYKNEEVSEEILSGLFINKKGFGVGVCGKLFNLDIIKKNCIRFHSERELLSEDAFFLIELFGHISSVSIVPENYYYYFQNENSFSRTFKKNLQDMNDNFLSNCICACKKYGYSQKVELHIKSRYLIYTLTGMKQIAASDMPFKEKINKINKVFKNQTLRSVVSKDVICLSKRQAKMFWVLFKLRCRSACYIMLWAKTRR